LVPQQVAVRSGRTAQLTMLPAATEVASKPFTVVAAKTAI
jgi:hypothetical protein